MLSSSWTPKSNGEWTEGLGIGGRGDTFNEVHNSRNLYHLEKQ